MNAETYTKEELEFLETWPNCATPDCEHKCCRIMGSDHCSPCSARIAGLSLQEWGNLIDQRRRSLGLPTGDDDDIQ